MKENCNTKPCQHEESNEIENRRTNTSAHTEISTEKNEDLTKVCCFSKKTQAGQKLGAFWILQANTGLGSVPKCVIIGCLTK